MSICVCVLCVHVCVCLCVSVHVIVCVCVCARMHFVFHNSQRRLRSDSLNNKDCFLEKYIYYPTRARFGKCSHYNQT